MNKPEIQVWGVDEMTRIFPDTLPPRGAARGAGWHLRAARGEYAGFQVAVRSDVKQADLAVRLHPLRAARAEIPVQALQVFRVGFVPIPIDAFDKGGELSQFRHQEIDVVLLGVRHPALLNAGVRHLQHPVRGIQVTAEGLEPLVPGIAEIA